MVTKMCFWPVLFIILGLTLGIVNMCMVFLWGNYRKQQNNDFHLCERFIGS